MKPVGVGEAYTTKIYYSLFFCENLGKPTDFWKNILQWIPKIIEATTFF